MDNSNLAVETQDPTKRRFGALYDEDKAIDSEFLEHLHHAIEHDDKAYLNDAIGPLHSSEIADVLNVLDADERAHLIILMGADFDFEALTEVDESVRRDILEYLPNTLIAEAFKELESDDVVYLLEDMEEEEQDEILARLPFTEQVRLRRSLDFPEDSAGRRMQTEFVAVPPFWTIGQVIDYMREDEGLPDSFAQVFVIDATFHLIGALDLDRILRTQRPIRVDEVMHEVRYAIPATMDQEEAAQIFEQYDLLSAAVVDDNDRLLGVLTIDDVVDVIQEEAEEDLMRLGGVGDEELSDTVIETARSRTPWLSVNLITASFSAIVIGLFDATIQQMVALAVLMPIVASMGGNAATQTMTVTVRAIATKSIDIYNAARIIRRETLVGLINGVIFAILIGLAAAIWFESYDLGYVIASAMVINMLAAALAGILIPLALNRFGADPAIASSVFVTMVTDVVGFFAFLGLATWWFGFAA